MAKNDFLSGSVFEFKVPKDLGFAYCKILDFRYIREFDGLLAKVFDYIVKEPLSDIRILASNDWLFGARRLACLPNTRGKGAWKFKGVVVSEDDNIIPDFKYSNKLSPLIEDESVINEWYAIKNIRESNNIPCTYMQVRHLEDTSVGSQYGIEIRTAMEFYRQQGLNIKENFDLNDTANYNIYRAMVNVPIYNTISKKIRGMALC
ncbi:hypothetical protein [Flavihumibacter profundi]|uniref:hypothetical protein n=1 Tax=Flavihumibacter profundi TaxID=2716883 RepID=UPI001CC71966|nr:hypothetical protein [Flavihumibacter profundi]MBZ5858569.1 hypothetical protein [Flavihumibacter profundi]